MLAPCTGLGVVSKVSLGIGVEALRASAAPLYNMEWAPHQSHTSLGVPAMVAGALYLGDLYLPVPGTPVISNCCSLTHTHTTHVHT